MSLREIAEVSNVNRERIRQAWTVLEYAPDFADAVLSWTDYQVIAPARLFPKFAEILIREEEPGILLFATEGLLELNADLEKYGTIQLSARQRERIESLLNESDGLRLFLTDAVEPFPGECLATTEIVERYAGYCSDQGWNMTTKKTEHSCPA